MPKSFQEGSLDLLDGIAFMKTVQPANFGRVIRMT